MIECTYLRYSKEKATGDQVAKITQCRLGCRKDPPYGHRRAEVERGRQSRKYQVRGQLHREIPDEEDASREVEIRPGHPEILLEPAESRL